METFQHVLTCSSEVVWKTRQKASEEFRQTLEKVHTPIDIISTILGNIPDHGSSISAEADLTTLFASQAQTTIGWHQFFLGRISGECRKLYERIYTPSKHPKPAVWSSRLVSAIWEYTHTIWKGRNQVVHGATVKAQLDK